MSASVRAIPRAVLRGRLPAAFAPVQTLGAAHTRPLSRVCAIAGQAWLRLAAAARGGGGLCGQPSPLLCDLRWRPELEAAIARLRVERGRRLLCADPLPPKGARCAASGSAAWRRRALRPARDKSAVGEQSQQLSTSQVTCVSSRRMLQCMTAIIRRKGVVFFGTADGASGLDRDKNNAHCDELESRVLRSQ